MLSLGDKTRKGSKIFVFWGKGSTALGGVFKGNFGV